MQEKMKGKRKEQSCDSWHGGPLKHDAMENARDHIVHDSISMKSPEQANSQTEKEEAAGV